MSDNVVVHVDLEPVRTGKLLRVLLDLIRRELSIVTVSVLLCRVAYNLVALFTACLGEYALVLLRGEKNSVPNGF